MQDGVSQAMAFIPARMSRARLTAIDAYLDGAFYRASAMFAGACHF